eukprot:TRINITY_DN20769_c0_g1_i1.p1 TRINITY_DN20769_c0_g1~~TRINITY_DN20769_c0_g1_i1.p1  ORF type:complete len:140 (+),score=27.80 TRINITY_DN20769_c0_g1_i1:62-421(+)
MCIRDRVVEAFNGEEALKAVTNIFSAGGNIGLVFMDCNMPVMDGYQATRTLKSWMKVGVISEFPVIALTAYVGENEERRCRESGMDDYYTKPCSLDQIDSCLKQWLPASKSQCFFSFMI